MPPTRIQPKINADLNLTCPTCGAVVKPGPQPTPQGSALMKNAPIILDTQVAWVFHVKQHGREEQNRRRRDAAALERRARHDRLCAHFYNYVPCRTPVMAALIQDAVGRAVLNGDLPAFVRKQSKARGVPLATARAFARRLGLVARLKTNPVLWEIPSCATSANP